MKVSDMEREHFHKLMKTLKMKRDREKEQEYEAYRNEIMTKQVKRNNRRR